MGEMVAERMVHIMGTKWHKKVNELREKVIRRSSIDCASRAFYRTPTSSSRMALCLASRSPWDRGVKIE